MGITLKKEIFVFERNLRRNAVQYSRSLKKSTIIMALPENITIKVLEETKELIMNGAAAKFIS
jgi:hypothetical protein